MNPNIQLSIYTKESELNVVTYQIPEIIQGSVALVLKGTFIKFSIQSDNNLWPVKIDKFKFIQLFMNLFINARQIMSNDGRIDVYCSNCQDCKSVKISVKDKGAGIGIDIIERVYSIPFFRTKQNGTGLGLHIVKNIRAAFLSNRNLTRELLLRYYCQE